MVLVFGFWFSKDASGVEQWHCNDFGSDTLESDEMAGQVLGLQGLGSRDVSDWRGHRSLLVLQRRHLVLRARHTQRCSTSVNHYLQGRVSTSTPLSASVSFLLIAASTSCYNIVYSRPAAQFAMSLFVSCSTQFWQPLCTCSSLIVHTT